MQRNLDLCREILKLVRDNGKPFDYYKIELPAYSDEDIKYNLKLLEEAGYLNTLKGSYDKIVHGSLSWDGHEYLDNVLNDQTWTKVKSVVLNKFGSVSFDVLRHAISEYIKGNLV